MTAWSALFITGELCLKTTRNRRILILGASGGVGTVATQILKSQGAIVIGTCSEDAIKLVESLGADAVYDYRSQDYFANVAAEGKSVYFFPFYTDISKYFIDTILYWIVRNLVIKMYPSLGNLINL